MNRCTKIAELSAFGLADFLQTKEDVSHYLSLVLADGDESALAHALGLVGNAPWLGRLGESAAASEAGLRETPRLARFRQQWLGLRCLDPVRLREIPARLETRDALELEMNPSPDRLEQTLPLRAPGDITPDQELRALQACVVNIAQDQASAVAFLQSAGILDAEAQLAEPYRH